MKFTKKMVEAKDRSAESLQQMKSKEEQLKRQSRIGALQKSYQSEEGWTRNYISKDSSLAIHMYIREQHSMHQIRNSSRQLKHKG